jgi:hypothetical protein
VRRLTAISLLLCFIALGTGSISYVHDLQHAHDDAAIAERAKTDGQPAPPAPRHDASNCAIHAVLQSPLMNVAWVPLLVCVGLWVLFLSELPVLVIAHRFALQLDCRGPPAC